MRKLEVKLLQNALDSFLHSCEEIFGGGTDICGRGSLDVQKSLSMPVWIEEDTAFCGSFLSLNFYARLAGTTMNESPCIAPHCVRGLSAHWHWAFTVKLMLEPEQKI